MVLFPQPDDTAHLPELTQPPTAIVAPAARLLVTQPAVAAQADSFPFSFLDEAASLAASVSPLTAPSSSPPLPSLTCRSWLCSTPGKALLTGGYLVLEQAYPGLVVALSARFHTTLVPCSEPALLQALSTPSQPAVYRARVGEAAGGAAEGAAVLAVFVLHAPQRSARLVEYWMHVVLDGGAGGAAGGVTAVRRYPAASEHNPFVLCSLYYAMHLLSALLPPATLRAKLAQPILLHVRGDHQFYSASRWQRTTRAGSTGRRDWAAAPHSSHRWWGR